MKISANQILIFIKETRMLSSKNIFINYFLEEKNSSLDSLLPALTNKHAIITCKKNTIRKKSNPII